MSVAVWSLFCSDELLEYSEWLPGCNNEVAILF